jgi:hypothetical protein
MTVVRLALRSLVHFRRTHVSVAFGVASAVAVLAGALLVGSSVRASLAELAVGRLGRAAIVVSAERPFAEALGERVSKGSVPEVRGQTPSGPGRGQTLSGPVGGLTPWTPLLSLRGVAVHDASERRAGDVQVYGVDRRFFEFHGVSVEPPVGDSVLVSPDLAAELSAAVGDAVRIRVARPTAIPLDSLQARKDDVGRSLRLRYRGTLARAQMGEFSLAPDQGPVRAAFVDLSRLQRDLGQPGVNTLLIAAPSAGSADAAAVRAGLAAVLDASDVGLTLTTLPESSTILVESASGLLDGVTATAVTTATAPESLDATPVLTWLATRMTVNGRTVPYSLITALGPNAGGDATLGRLLGANGPEAALEQNRTPPIVLNDWAARDVRAAPGDAVEIEYFRWADEGRLVTDRASFRLAGVVPIAGLASDRRLAPAYPGITDTNSIADWDPPFPIDLALVRPSDDEYWQRFRTTSKAFIPLGVGQQLWRTRHGQLTSVRLRPAAPGADLDAIAARVRRATVRALDPMQAGFTVVDVRRQALSAAAGTTDFGAYFSYFSAFLMVSALLLAALFFRLSVEQRLAEIGVLRATGFSLTAVRRLFLIEGGVVSIAGAGLGVVLAIAWAALMMHGLRTWWVDAVGTTLLELHVDPRSLVIGAVGGALAAVVSIAITVRGLSRSTPRQLMAGGRQADAGPRRDGGTRGGRQGSWLAVGSLAAAIALSVLSVVRLVPPAGGFFGAGTLVLVGGLAAFRRWLGRRRQDIGGGSGGLGGVIRLGVGNASWRPGRSLTAAGLVASAVFLLVSVDAFRKPAAAAGGAASGTGGFALIAESTLPIVHDPSTPEGRVALGLELKAGEAAWSGVDVVAARLRTGDAASCLNLYQPTRPRVLGVPERFVEAGRFRFASSLAATDVERENPWRLLGAPDAEGVVPAIADATSLEYALHASVGDVITIDADTARPVRLRIVGALDDSMLQGELLVSERAFLTLFPEVAGYRVLLVGVAPASPARVSEVARLVEQRLEPYGVDAQESARRLEAYHRVENTYLSTFQTLGGLGLVLGSFGLVAIIARNVLERRRELALLGAAGFTGRDLQVLVAAEQLSLVAAGLAVGLAAALVAVIPVLVARGGGVPMLPLIWPAGVGLTGLASTLWATRGVRRLPLVASLAGE